MNNSIAQPIAFIIILMVYLAYGVMSSYFAFTLSDSEVEKLTGARKSLYKHGIAFPAILMMVVVFGFLYMSATSIYSDMLPRTIETLDYINDIR